MSASRTASSRHRARMRAVQALYQWQLTGQAADEILAQFFEEQSMALVDTAYFETLLRSVVSRAEALDQALAPFLDRAMARVDPVERAILRLGAWELQHSPEVPYRVVLDEAVELAHTFGAEQGHAFVNGVLDKAARAWRTGEHEPAS